VDVPEWRQILNTSDTEMGAEQGVKAQQAPQMRDTMQRHFSMQITSEKHIDPY
jgi:hypothetical protein